MTAGDSAYTVVLTPPGAGAIALLRVTGAGAVAVVNRVFRSKPGERVGFLRSESACYGLLCDGDEVLDDVVAVRTQVSGEPCVDITSHGGVRVLERILLALERAGAPVRDPACSIWPICNRIEQEAIDLLPGARTARAAKFLARQRKELPERLGAIAAVCGERLPDAVDALTELCRGYRLARLLLEGVRIALVGPPNSGKSTLFNRLVGRSAAVVSPQAGTTRDWISTEIEIEGVPCVLFDTPGGRETGDALEHQAIQRAQHLVGGIGTIVLVMDGSAPLPQQASESTARASVIAANKSDLPAAWGLAELGGCRLGAEVQTMRVSAVQGTGCAELLSAVVAAAGLRSTDSDTPGLFTPRQEEVAKEALGRLEEGQISQAVEKICSELIGPWQDDGPKGGL